MEAFKSQISSCSLLMPANTEGQSGDHLADSTGLWMEVKPITGVRQPSFHSWTVQSAEPLRNRSWLNGDHWTWLTGHCRDKGKEGRRHGSICGRPSGE